MPPIVARAATSSGGPGTRSGQVEVP